MRICVQGLWHLGSVTAACLAYLGHQVVGLDPDRSSISSLSNGKAPLFEPGLDALILSSMESNLLSFTSDVENACMDVDLLWVTFDTPVNEDDVADIDYVMDQVKSTIRFLPNGALVLLSSQLPVGSISILENFSREFFSYKKISFACSPENLRLGNAINIFLNPDRIVVGIRSESDKKTLEQLLLPLTKKVEWMSVESAEMTKHALNAFLAISVTFANEIASICELVGADAKEVELGLKSESRIGPKAYLSPGGPFAGGTLARDIEFLGKISQDCLLATPLLSSVKLSNDAHKKWVQRKLLERFPDPTAIQVSMWGLTYKAGTDTLRRSLAVELVDWLLDRGGRVQVYDPMVKELPIHWGDRVKKCVGPLDNLRGIQVLVVGTEWPEFKDDARRLHEFADSNLVVIDANRHLKASLEGTAFDYLSVGSKKSS